MNGKTVARRDEKQNEKETDEGRRKTDKKKISEKRERKEIQKKNV